VGLRAPMRNILEYLPTDAQSDVIAEYNRRRKSKFTGYIAWLFLGWHYLYLRRVGLQFAFWVTLGGAGIWWFIDLFRVGPIINRMNEDTFRDLAQQYSTIYQNRPVSPIVVPHTQPVLDAVSSYSIADNPVYLDTEFDAPPQSKAVLYFSACLVIIALSYGTYRTVTMGTFLGIPDQSYTSELMNENAREAGCSIDENSRRPCVFHPHRDGGFTGFTIVAYDGGTYEFHKIGSGVMNVVHHGETTELLGNYHWDKSDRACWVQDQRRICVW
jgi:TM2 domain-containing membrane protein YozV